MSDDSTDKLARELHSFSSAREEPEGHVYTPPKGSPILALPPDAKMYEPGAPTKQTDLLAPYERRHIIPIAMMIAPVFGVTPVPDDVFRAAPAYAKSNLFCIFSRSGITRHGNVLHWDAVVVVVQKLCVVRVQCTLQPQTDEFVIVRMLLWSRQNQCYHPIEDKQTKRIDPSVIPYVLDRYAAVEKIQ